MGLLTRYGDRRDKDGDARPGPILEVASTPPGDRHQKGPARQRCQRWGPYSEVRLDQVRPTCPQQDSNLRTRLRRPALYPLSYRGKTAVNSRRLTVADGSPADDEQTTRPRHRS